MEVNSLDMSLAGFLASGSRAEWIIENDMEIFVRKSYRNIPGHSKLFYCFDIANVTASVKGAGLFDNWFHLVQDILVQYSFDAIYVENVMTDRFADYFRKQKLIETGDLSSIPSFFKILQEIT